MCGGDSKVDYGYVSCGSWGGYIRRRGFSRVAFGNGDGAEGPDGIP